MKILKGFIATVACLLATYSYAFGNKETSTVSVYLINHTKETFNFINVSGHDKVNNSFNLTSTTLQPKSAIHIFGTTTGLNDLQGNLYFVDSMGKHYHLSIIDKLKFHVGQPTFTFFSDDEKSISRLTYKAFNKEGGPHALSYTEATVEIEA